MKDLFYVCAQPASYYYSWQVDAMLLSFKENGGVDLNNVHVVCATFNGNDADPWFLKVEEKWAKEGVIFEYYQDTRPKRGYISSIRPHILEKHWQKYPWLVEKNIMYHDCDIALSKPIPLYDKLSPNLEKTCFLSDTISYIGAKYIMGKGHDLLEEMCEIAQISPNLVRMKESESGGAQYLLKPGIDITFWQEVYHLSEDLFTKITKRVNEIKKEEPEWHTLQIWCADMWAVLWTLWKRGYETPCSPDLDFTWGTQTKSEWDKHAIYHNAGVVKEEIANDVAGPFYKALYMANPPITAPRPGKNWASENYFDLILRSYNDTAGVDRELQGISVVTLTWRRPELLQEAIHSFLLQEDPKAEMVIVNDDPEVSYYVEDEYVKRGVRIINTKQKFKTFMSKLKFAFEQANYEYAYRLDDDDLLDENALKIARAEITANPGKDIYHSERHWFVNMVRPEQNGISGGINNGNILSRDFVQKLDWKNAPEPPGEDQWYYRDSHATHHTWAEPTMLYRWAASQYSLTHKRKEQTIDEFADVKTQLTNSQRGKVLLTPDFREDWYSKKVL